MSSCSSHDTFTHIGSMKAGRDLSVSGHGSRVDLSNSRLVAGRDVDICGEHGVRVQNNLYAPRDLSVSTGKCQVVTKNPKLSEAVDEMKNKTGILSAENRRLSETLRGIENKTGTLSAENRRLLETLRGIKNKTDRLDVRDRGGFTTVTPNIPSATIRIK